MQTFKQYMLNEMGGDVAVGFRSPRTGQLDSRRAERAIKPVMLDADVLLRRADRISAETLVSKANTLLHTFVSEYEKLGDEATELKAKIADKYTKVKQLLQQKEQTVEDCVQMLEQVANLLNG